MDAIHKKVLNACRTVIIQDLDVTTILDQLAEKEVMSSEQRQRITLQTTREDQARTLLDVVVTRGPNAYSDVRNSLQDNYKWLVEKLDYEEAKLKLKNEGLHPPEILPAKNKVPSQNARLPTLLILGKMGVGKSSLCNVLAGKSHDSTSFPVSAEPKSCTQATQVGVYNFLGNEGNEFMMIDTMGFDDPTKNHDADIIADLVEKLRTEVEYVNLVLIALDGNNPRIDRALISMLKIFQAMFTNDIWKHIGIAFTKLTMDPKMKARREKNNHLTDQEKGNAYLKEVVRLFPECRAENLVFFHLDAQYDRDDEGEAGTFKIEAESLWSLFKEKPELSTDQVAKVKTENEELNSRIEQEVAMKVAAMKVASTVDNAKPEGTTELEKMEGANRKRKKKWYKKIFNF